MYANQHVIKVERAVYLGKFQELISEFNSESNVEYFNFKYVLPYFFISKVFFVVNKYAMHSDIISK